MSSNVVPLYYRIYSELKSRILKGFYADGKLPSELRLCEEFGASRITVRNALEQLRKEGLIHREKGSGTFIKKFQSEEELSRLTGFSDEMKGRQVSSIVLENKLVPVPIDAQDRFGVTEGSLVVHLKRVRLIDERPIAVESSFINPSVDLRLLNVLNRDMSHSSLYHFIQDELGIKLARAEEELEVVKIGRDEAKLLNVKPGECAVVRKRFTYTVDERCIEYVLSVYRADEYKFRIVRR